jgi:hypothetical protein
LEGTLQELNEEQFSNLTDSTKALTLKEEKINVQKLNRLLAYVKVHDLDEWKKMNFYDECNLERHQHEEDLYPKNIF